MSTYSDNLFIICLSVVFFSLIVAISAYSINDRVLMSKNIQTAIERGINPLSVRCSYSKGDEPLCVAYAANSESSVVESISTKK